MATITRNDLALKLRDAFGFTAAQSGKLIDVIFMKSVNHLSMAKK